MGPSLRGDVRRELEFEQRDLILEQKLALFHALNLQFVERGMRQQAFDGSIEFAVLQLEFDDTRLDLF